MHYFFLFLIMSTQTFCSFHIFSPVVELLHILSSKVNYAPDILYLRIFISSHASCCFMHVAALLLLKTVCKIP